MACEWKQVELGEVAEVVGGATPDTRVPEYYGGDIPWITPKDLSGYGFRKISRGERMLTSEGLRSCGTKLMPAGTVLLTSRAPIGYVAIAERPVCTNQGFKSLVLKPDQCPEFYYYLLKHNTETLERHATGSTFKEISTTIVKSLKFRVPSYSEQKRIASILGALDDKIELNRRMNETLEQMARALFKSWFVDFEPVRAKATGRQPVGMDKATANLFPDSFEDSELGKIPKGWVVRSLDEIAHFLNGLALQKYPPNDGPSLPVVKIAQLRKGDSAGADRCSANLPSTYIIQDGDVLFSWSGSLEVELWCGGAGALNQHLFKVTSAEFPKWFFYLWTRWHLTEFRLIAAGKATTMGHIQRGHLTAAKVLVVPRALLDEMTVRMSPIIAQIITNRVQSRTLSTMRDALLPKLLSCEYNF